MDIINVEDLSSRVKGYSYKINLSKILYKKFNK